MITTEQLIAADNKELQEISKQLDQSDIKNLVEWLLEKDDKIRYQSLLLLQDRSFNSEDVYAFWDVFWSKLKNVNSYQRSIGLMLIAANARWDSQNRFDSAFPDYFALLHDEKPITIRQSIQALHSIIPYKRHLLEKIADELMALHLPDIKETMRKLVLLDILGVLAEIRQYGATDRIDTYIMNALSGGLLDRKAKKQIEAMLQEGA